MESKKLKYRSFNSVWRARERHICLKYNFWFALASNWNGHLRWFLQSCDPENDQLISFFQNELVIDLVNVKFTWLYISIVCSCFWITKSEFQESISVLFWSPSWKLRRWKGSEHCSCSLASQWPHACRGGAHTCPHRKVRLKLVWRRAASTPRTYFRAKGPYIRIDGICSLLQLKNF